jgi:hypothetical protein
LAAKRSLAAFEAVYCSGLFITDPALVTALAILFDRVYLPNYIEYVLEFPRRFRIENRSILPLTRSDISIRGNDSGDFSVLSNLTPEQRLTALNYMIMTEAFHRQYQPLLGSVFESSLEPHWDKTTAAQIASPIRGHLQPGRVQAGLRMNIQAHPQPYVDGLIEAGVVPVLGAHHIPTVETHASPRVARNVAAILAINAVRLVLPATRGAPPEVILEARHRLRDYLPPFWVSMMSLSVSIREAISQGGQSPEIDRAIADTVDTVVFPTLIELKHKLAKERRQWFHRILARGGRTLHVAMGHPDATAVDFISAGLMLGADVAIDAAQAASMATEARRNSPLTLLLELDRLLDQ